MTKETGLSLIAKERQEQIEKHGRTIQQDIDCNDNGQLIEGAAYVLSASFAYPGPCDDDCPDDWDKDIWRHMLSKPEKERLIIAGALIAAEIDRLLALEGEAPPTEK